MRQHDGHAGLFVAIGVGTDLARGLGTNRADEAVERRVVDERLEPPGRALDVEGNTFSL